MELNERMKLAGNALQRLKEIAEKENLSDIERDGMIRRFEFTFDILWKCGKDYLARYEEIEVLSPKKVIRLFREIGMFTDEETENLLEAANDRNLTSHTYKEDLIKKIAERIPAYEKLFTEWFNQMNR